MIKLKYKVSAVTVTYGNRWEFLSEVIKRLLSFNNITNVIVVNNASPYSVKDKVASLNDTRITVIDCEENLGSTGGYKLGMACAHKKDVDFVWLLDDDNLPEEGALDALLTTWDELDAADNKKALFCLRTDRPHHIHIAQGQSPSRYYLIPDNFLNFTILRPFGKFLKLADKFKKNRRYQNRAEMPYASYGGFFFHKTMIDLIGYPDEKFYLYFDDAEYTYRVTTTGGKVWLVPGSIVNDIDHSYQVNYKRKFLHSIHLDLWNYRTYYMTRNGMYFNKQNALKTPVIFKINKWLFMCWLKFLSIVGSKQNEYRKLSNAVEDGLQGRLGKAAPEKF
ncbi:MAG: glycosyltransferase [Sphingobacteriaceae bacterium]|nr:MAG: glycosyltransferase [Sphingobacteriaceae bacterium]